MHRKDELKQNLNRIIQESSAFLPEERAVWTQIFNAMADYQESLLTGSDKEEPLPEQHSAWCIQCGITSLKNAGNSRYFISPADNLSDHDFPFGNPESNSAPKKDGRYFIAGTGYLDTAYSDVQALTGRNRQYRGILPDGSKFFYTLILQSHILHCEKMLYRLADFWHITAPVIYAPFLRRLVYLETEEPVPPEADFRLSENGLECLKSGWRSFWNVEITDAPYGIRNGRNYYYQLAPEEYESRLVFEKIRSDDAEKISVSSETMEDVRDCLEKIKLFPVSGIPEIRQKDMIAFLNQGSIAPDVRLFSRADIFRFVSGFRNLACLEEVFTSYPEGLHICAYELDYGYPAPSAYFHENGRPSVFLSFQKQEDAYFDDKVIYLMHILQRQFPEYIWKGGYFA